MFKKWKKNKLHRRGRIYLNRRDNRRNKLEEHNKVKINPHALRLLFLHFLLLLFPAHSPNTKTLLLDLLVFGASRAELALFLDDARVHAFDDLFHYAGVLAGVDHRGLEGGVGEGFDGDGLEGVVGGDVFEDLFWVEGVAVL